MNHFRIDSTIEKQLMLPTRHFFAGAALILPSVALSQANHSEGYRVTTPITARAAGVEWRPTVIELERGMSRERQLHSAEERRAELRERKTWSKSRYVLVGSIVGGVAGAIAGAYKPCDAGCRDYSADQVNVIIGGAAGALLGAAGGWLVYSIRRA